MRAADVAKALLDLGFHAPTMYFPLIVEEALMIEPTETESPETVEALAAALLAIARRARRGPGGRPRAPPHHPGAPPRRCPGRPPPGAHLVHGGRVKPAMGIDVGGLRDQGGRRRPGQRRPADLAAPGGHPQPVHAQGGGPGDGPPGGPRRVGQALSASPSPRWCATAWCTRAANIAPSWIGTDAVGADRDGHRPAHRRGQRRRRRRPGRDAGGRRPGPGRAWCCS